MKRSTARLLSELPKVFKIANTVLEESPQPYVPPTSETASKEIILLPWSAPFSLAKPGFVRQGSTHGYRRRKRWCDHWARQGTV